MNDSTFCIFTAFEVLSVYQVSFSIPTVHVSTGSHQQF